VPSASLLVPETDVAATIIGDVTTGAAVTACTVTVLENPLSKLPLAVAVALTSCPTVNAVRPVFVHAPDATVVVAIPVAEPST